MVWLNQLAWFGLAAIAVPVVVHLLAHRRAERIPFPTLRFIQPTRLAATQRRALEDLPLLAVRSAIVAAAVAAFAGPLVVTPARQAQWNQRLVTETVDSSPLADGIHRAVARLESAPPARRELVIAAPLTIGSLSDTDLASIPKDVGIRFVRTATLPASRSISAPALITRTHVIHRNVTLDGGATTVREESEVASATWPIEIVAPPNLQRTADAALAAVLSLRVRVPPPDHKARLVLLAAPTAEAPSPIRSPWMADAIARIARDGDLREEAARVPRGLADARFGKSPWHTLASAADGRPLASAAASSDTLVVASIARTGDLLVPTVLRAIANGLAPAEDLSGSEVVPIADGQLRAWTREPGAPPPPRPETVERDDRRWLWAGVLILLAVETWMRRSRRDAEDMIEEAPARVA